MVSFNLATPWHFAVGLSQGVRSRAKSEETQDDLKDEIKWKQNQIFPWKVFSCFFSECESISLAWIKNNNLNSLQLLAFFRGFHPHNCSSAGIVWPTPSKELWLCDNRWDGWKTRQKQNKLGRTLWKMQSKWILILECLVIMMFIWDVLVAKWLRHMTFVKCHPASFPLRISWPDLVWNEKATDRNSSQRFRAKTKVMVMMFQIFSYKVLFLH